MEGSECTCGGSDTPQPNKPDDGFDEDTSSKEPDFVPLNVTNDVGHRLTSQESAVLAFKTLGLKHKSEEYGDIGGT